MSNQNQSGPWQYSFGGNFIGAATTTTTIQIPATTTTTQITIGSGGAGGSGTILTWGATGAGWYWDEETEKARKILNDLKVPTSPKELLALLRNKEERELVMRRLDLAAFE